VADWRWVSYDLRTGTQLGDLPMSYWTHKDLLKDAGEFSGQMHASGDASTARDALGATTPSQTLVVPVRNGLPLGYGGIVWRNDMASIAGAGMFSFFDAQTLNVRKSWTAVDQHTLVKELVDWVQSTDGGNIHIDTTATDPSGQPRDQTWEVWEAKNIGEAIREKSDNIHGYDFDVRVELDANVLTRRLRLWTPRRGTPYIQGNSPVFRMEGRRGNVLSVTSVPKDATQMATVVVALGQEIDATTHERLRRTNVRSDLIALGWPKLCHVLDLPDVKLGTTLQDHADGYASYYAGVAIDQIVLEVNPSDETFPWGTWDLGDDCQVVIPPGVDPWWPDGFDETRRVTAHQWTVDGTGEHLQVTTGRMLP
jgi:hypothetical protein